ncbi:hypothetical protein AVEN_136763-1 [Araneus ventricosus]|uniref:Uncharacterized protein n=1 Tax=Araneus ventricosus TaxID=182803 RepID=A0A4Y2PS50_ARAVE|nr:hypothetical protein AVEN_133174-1 [Araneus ventricosus]GBN53693.1 hypothetical protein AVEN_136763-1 [Araneus ventricosus]
MITKTCNRGALCHIKDMSKNKERYCQQNGTPPPHYTDMRKYRWTGVKDEEIEVTKRRQNIVKVFSSFSCVYESMTTNKSHTAKESELNPAVATINMSLVSKRIISPITSGPSDNPSHYITTHH